MRHLAFLLPAFALAQAPEPPPEEESQAEATVIDVKVVDVAGGLAYIEPGESAGVTVGIEVRIRKRSFQVVAVSARYAAIELRGETVRRGAKGKATVTDVEPPVIERIETPRPLSAFKGQWREPSRPSESAEPKHVPLGSPTRTQKARGAVFAHAVVVSPSDGPSFVAGSLGGRVSAEAYSRLGFDADAAAQIWSGNGLAGSDDVHPAARVRELRLRWGDPADPLVSLGRLRWTSMLVGPLDGGKVSAPVGPVKLSAWGGEMPDELSGAPSLDASAFGVEAEMDRPDVALAPRVALAAGGTTWNGELDERRFALDASVERGPLRALAFAELAGFSGDNPWGAGSLELQAASIDLSSRFDRVRISGRFGARRPERSLRLAAALPPEWLCQRDPRAPGEAEPCVFAPLRTETSVTAGWANPRFSVDGGLTLIRAEESDLATEVTGFGLVGVRAGGGVRLDAGGDAGRLDWLDWQGGSIGVGRLFWRDRVDVGLRYGLTRLLPTGSLNTFYEHRAGTRATLDLRKVSLAGDITVLRGAEADAVLGLIMAIWRLP